MHGEPSLHTPSITQPSALSEFIQQARAGERELGGEPLRWNRAELYTGRENRWTGQDTHEASDAAGVD